LKAIITGSEGFIGKFLCTRLNGLFDVIRIDTKTGGDAVRIEPLLAQGDIDAVFHLAAETSVFNDRLDDIERENIHAFMAVATACHRHGVKLVYASSSTANACNTTSMYGMSKRFNEQFAKAYCPSATGVRLHNVYGREPRQGTLLYNLLHGPCTIYNGGRNVRHFTYIGDAAEALIYAYGSNRQLVNVRNPTSNTVREFCDEVAKYRDLNLDYTDELRPLDNFAQSVDEGIYCVPLHYRDIGHGLALTFAK
jgi:UDP-glucuronate 4-epimerase